jgi:hypothetical protein
MACGRPDALEYLGLSDQDWGPAYADEWPYETFAEYWRGPKPCPTEQEIADAITALQNTPPEE